MLRRLGIRGKVLAVLSVPVLVLFVLAGVISSQSLDDVRTARAVTELLSALDLSRDLSRAMQAEREATVRSMSGDAEAAAGLEDVRAATDQAVMLAGHAATTVDLDVLDPLVGRAVTGLDEQMEAVLDLRNAVDHRAVNVRAAFVGYTTVVERITRFPSVVAHALDDRRVAAIINAQTDVAMTAERYGQEQIFGLAVLNGARGAADNQLFLSIFPATTLQHETATLAVRDLALGDRFDVPPLISGVQNYGNVRTIASRGTATYTGFVNPETWYELADQQVREFAPLQRLLRTEGENRAQEVSAAALRTAVVTIALAALAVVASIIVAFSIARQIVVPLRRLTQAAGHVRDELPRLVEQVAIPGRGPDLTLARIPVTSKDEVGRLATAFNEVNATTIEVAQEQAALRASISEMFVNVARRDQVLLNRQLSFIDALERSEEDPATLADLFRLDHLATRMRRNAESLLVLAGIDTGRRLRDALPISDVIRTASSEIEHYERVHLDLPIDPAMVGHMALPAAHLLAELLENATVFSDPGTPVQVSTGRDERHVLVTVFDQGLGMTPAELEEANTKIRATSASDVVGAQRLGLFVVGRISARLNADVVLSLGPDGTGTLATVRLPLSLFADAEHIPTTAPVAQRAQIESYAGPTAADDASPYGRAPEQLQDVAAGSLGSVENPAAEVDLAALTDGQTGLGLPRRRRGADGADAAESEAPVPGAAAPAPRTNVYRDEDDAAAAPSIPLAPRAEALAGAAALPETDTWTPPVIESNPLGVRRGSGDGAADGWAPEAVEADATSGSLPTRGAATDQAPDAQPALPSRAPAAELPTRGPATGGELPTREPAAASRAFPVRPSGDGGGLPTRTPAAPVAMSGLPSSSTPSSPEVGQQNRGAMFTGFRSRRAELAAASVAQGDRADAAPAAGDGADRLAAAAAGAAAFFGRPAQRDDDGATDAVAPVTDQPGVSGAPEGAEVPTAEVTPPSADVTEVRRTRRGRHAYYPGEERGAVTGAHGTVEVSAEAVESAPVEETQPAVVEQPTWTVPALEEDEDQTWSAPLFDEPEGVDAAPAWEPTAVEADAVEQDTPEQVLPEQPVPAEAAAEPLPRRTVGWEPGELDGAPVWDAPQQDVAPVWEAPQQDVAPVWEVPQQDAAPVWEAPQQEATPTWGPPAAEAAQPAATWAPTSASGPAELSTSSDDQPAPRKRRWWQLGKGKKQAATEPAPETFAVPETSAVPQATVIEPAPESSDVVPAAVDGFAAPEPAPVRESAWGASEPGAHAAPTGADAARRSGATAFFPVREPAAPSSAAAAAPAAPSAPLTPSGHAAAPAWEIPHPHPAPPQPDAVPTGGWEPQAGWDAPEAFPSAPAAPSAPEPSEVPAGSFAPAPSGATTFTPHAGGLEDDVANMLAQRADLAQQALAELSQLSSYRPQAVSGAGSSLTRRTPGTIPAAPEIKTSATARPARDANQVRSLLSSFQSGSTRGREAGDGDGAETAGVGASLAGPENGPDGGGSGHPGADHDPTARGTSW